MKIIVITSSEKVENEVQKIEELFKEGLEVLHLRKPSWDIKKYEELLTKISFKYYKKIVLHSHYKLAEKYNIKGIHLTGSYIAANMPMVKEIINSAQKRNLSVSTSMHSINEIKENKLKYNYVFLSPVFESISKQDYKSSFQPEILKSFLEGYNKTTEIYALGGINKLTAMNAKNIGFSGVAVLGAIWNSNIDVVKSYKEIKQNV